MREILRNLRDISIHALHEESDVTSYPRASISPVFQSTLSMRRATHETLHTIDILTISIHALHEESDVTMTHILFYLFSISIHALHEESDLTAGMRAAPTS